MKEIAVSFRITFDADNVSGTKLYKMEQHLLDWLREVTNNAEQLRRLCRDLEGIAEQPIDEFFMMAIDDLTTNRQASLMERISKKRAA